MKRAEQLRLIGLSALLACALGVHLTAKLGGARDGPRPPPVAPTVALTAGPPTERTLEGGETHGYEIQLAADDFLHLVAEQRGIDLALSFFDPRGRRLLEVDSPTDDSGPETVVAMAPAPGLYRVEVRAFGDASKTGSYRLEVESLRPATPDDREQAKAAALFATAEGLRRGKSSRPAVEMHREALGIWESLGDQRWQATAHDRLGRDHGDLGEWAIALEHHRAAARLFGATGDVRLEAMSLHFAGRACQSLGRREEALADYQAALPLRERAGDRRGAAFTLNNIGHVAAALDDLEQAADAYDQALRRWREIGDLPQEANTLRNLGLLDLSVGRVEEARRRFDRALELSSGLGDRRGMADALDLAGQAFDETRDLDAALDRYHQSLVLRRQTGDRRGLAVVLSNIGLVHKRRERFDVAERFYQEALKIFLSLDDRPAQATVLRHLGSIRQAQDDLAAAFDLYRQALPIHRDVGDPAGEAETLAAIAGAERQRDDLPAARQAIEAALEILESVRATAVSPELRATYFSTVRDHFEFSIDLLMELDRRRPGAGFAALALRASEQARARSLLDVLGQSGLGPAAASAADLAREERDIHGEIDALEDRRLALLRTGAAPAGELERLEAEIRELLGRLERIRVRMRLASPRYAALAQPRPASLDEIQREALDAETLLLEYQLGRERSFLWAVEADALHAFTLPGRAEIEELARQAHQGLALSSRRESRYPTERVLCELSRVLLQPVTERLSTKRLLIVADGALEVVPFAVLPDPAGLSGCPGGPPLIARHEVVTLPSASTLLALRRDGRTRPRPTARLAVVADPVFDPLDERVRRRAAPAGSAPSAARAEPRPAAASLDVRRSAEEVGIASFARLPFSRAEAQAVLGLVRPETRFAAFDFAASKELATSGRLADYEIVHFATHALVNSKHPELSGIVLSLVDEEGRPRDGFLRLHEIYGLDLPIELVVLSGCRTALGKEVRGEGLVGLTRGFLHAGARSTLVSLWSISDRATAELMARFYHHLLVEGRNPAAALQRAQLSMWQEAAWQAPSHWAGFVLQGDWRATELNRAATDGSREG